LTNFVSRIYNIDDTFTEEDFSDVRMLEYNLQRGNIAEIVDDAKQKKPRKSKVEKIDELVDEIDRFLE